MTVRTNAPTGRREERDGATHVVYTRTFRAPIDDVWAAATEPDRMQRWIGTWSGDPATGSVEFRMTAEGDDVSAETYLVEVCEAPRLLVVRSAEAMYGTVWRLRVDLEEADGVTTLTFAQQVDSAAVAGDVGPGWEYYLDRLAAAHAGDDVTAIAWSDYESQSEHYRSLFG